MQGGATFTEPPPLLAVIGPADPDGDESASSCIVEGGSAPGANAATPNHATAAEQVAVDGAGRGGLKVEGMDSHLGPVERLLAALEGRWWTPVGHQQPLERLGTSPLRSNAGVADLDQEGDSEGTEP